MSEEPLHPESEQSRQELLDQIYYLRDVAGEREQQIRRLQASGTTEAGKNAIAELDRILHSRSWWLTAPLRGLAQALVRSGGEPRPMSENSRQDLLHEIQRLRTAVDERDRHIRRLQEGGSEADERANAELEQVLHSRSWRLTVPLRWLARALGRSRRAEPATIIGVAPRFSDLRGGEAAETRRPPESHAVEVRVPGDKQLYVDITELALRQGKTGVQRVTREILQALSAAPPNGYTVRPVYAAPGQPYRLAERFAENLYGVANNAPADVMMDARTGDVFLGLDHSMQAVVEHASDLDAMRRRGVRIWFECNDTLPLVHPEWFPAEVPPKFEAWLRTVLDIADGVACISRATETGLRRWLDEWRIQREHPLMLGHFPLGADLVPHMPNAVTITEETSAMLKRLRGRSVFLMVGTVEPRKGHAQALEAFNRLWAGGDNVALVIVGMPGWMTEVVQRRIRHHDAFGQRLFWFMDANDALLEKLYATCTALLAPSEGEGYGLPLVEAARHGLPILCRDLPVFHEVAGEHATYFSGFDAEALAHAIREWQDSRRRRTVPVTRDMPWFTWAESARQLMGLILGNDKTMQSPQPSP